MAKLLRTPYGRFRIALDLYNAFNASPVLARNNNYGITGVGWGTPNAVLGGLLAKFGVQYNWN